MDAKATGDLRAAIYQKTAALPCLTCPYSDCIHAKNYRNCARFMEGYRAAKSPSYRNSGRRKREKETDGART